MIIIQASEQSSVSLNVLVLIYKYFLNIFALRVKLQTIPSKVNTFNSRMWHLQKKIDANANDWAGLIPFLRLWEFFVVRTQNTRAHMEDYIQQRGTEDGHKP